jgi:hypothetical protein
MKDELESHGKIGGFYALGNKAKWRRKSFGSPSRGNTRKRSGGAQEERRILLALESFCKYGVAI